MFFNSFTEKLIIVNKKNVKLTKKEIFIDKIRKVLETEKKYKIKECKVYLYVEIENLNSKKKFDFCMKHSFEFNDYLVKKEKIV